MKQTKINIEALERQDRTEKIVVFILLFAAIICAIWAFMRSKDSAIMDNGFEETNISATIPAETESEENVVDEGQEEISEEEMSSVENPDTESVRGILAVGLFAKPSNANSMRDKLNELGFSGTTKTRADGKIIVGVETTADDAVLHGKIINHFDDAVFVANN